MIALGPLQTQPQLGILLLRFGQFSRERIGLALPGFGPRRSGAKPSRMPA